MCCKEGFRPHSFLKHNIFYFNKISILIYFHTLTVKLTRIRSACFVLNQQDEQSIGPNHLLSSLIQHSSRFISWATPSHLVSVCRPFCGTRVVVIWFFDNFSIIFKLVNLFMCPYAERSATVFVYKDYRILSHSKFNTCIKTKRHTTCF